MAFEFIDSDKLAPAGYSHVAVVTGGTTIYVSGQVSSDVEGNSVSDDFEEQIRQVFANLQFALAAAGATFEHIVKLNSYVVGMNTERVAVFRRVRGELFGTHKPTSTLVDTGALVNPKYLVEIEAIAVLP